MALRVPQSKIAPCGSAFRVGARSVATTLVAANAPVWSMRWTSATHNFVLQNLALGFSLTTAFGAAQEVGFGLYFASPFTVSDTLQQAIVLTARNGKLDSNFPLSSQIAAGDMRISNAAAITAGTRTLDANPLYMQFGCNNVVGQENGMGGGMGQWFGVFDAENPITVRFNEGLVINNLVLMGAAGVMNIYVTVEWMEVPIGMA